MIFSLPNFYLYTVCGSFAAYLFSTNKDFELIGKNLKRILPKNISELLVNLIIFAVIIFFVSFVVDVLSTPANTKEAMLVGLGSASIIKSGIQKLKKEDS